MRAAVPGAMLGAMLGATCAPSWCSSRSPAAWAGMAWAAVPLYRIFCSVTGYSGTPLRADSGADRVLDRTVPMRFDASTAAACRGRSGPAQNTLKRRIPARRTSPSSRRRTRPTGRSPGTATFNVAPPLVGGYFVKIDCFCFTEQTLEPGQTAPMPVTFFVDPDIADEPEAATSARSRSPTPSSRNPRPQAAPRAGPATTTPAGRLTGGPWRTRRTTRTTSSTPAPGRSWARSARITMLAGAVLWMHDITLVVAIIGLLLVLYTMFVWWRDVVHESRAGDHTPVVRIGLRLGFIMFIMSEVMFFAAWFWAFFKFAIFPMPEIDVQTVVTSGGPIGTFGPNDGPYVRPLGPAADQHADPAALGLHRHLGAPRPDRGQAPGPDLGPARHGLPRRRRSRSSRPSSTAMPASPSAPTSSAASSSWRRASTASTSSSARSS